MSHIIMHEAIKISVYLHTSYAKCPVVHHQLQLNIINFCAVQFEVLHWMVLLYQHKNYSIFQLKPIGSGQNWIISIDLLYYSYIASYILTYHTYTDCMHVASYICFKIQQLSSSSQLHRKNKQAELIMQLARVTKFVELK